jgi:serine protease
MSFGTRARRWSARGGVAAIVLLASAGAQAAATATTAAQAAVAPAAVAASPPPVTNPYAPAYHHRYRRGAVPTRGDAAHMASWARQHPNAVAASPADSDGALPSASSSGTKPASANNVSYGGGVGGIGVTTGDEKVYLVFYGSQWGTQTTNPATGIVTFSNDPSGEAPYVQGLFRGLGTGEKWSGVMTQYCQGVSAGAQTCPARARHVAYPHGGTLAGVWYDSSSASPDQATAHQLAQETASAAAEFGNTTAAANRDAQYIILSPHGSDPDQYQQGGFCAWHDYTGDSFLDGGGAVSPGYLAFTNMPYVTDFGVSCGAKFIANGSDGERDGVSIVVGHEYAETITDQEPDGGWTGPGDEVADKCAWLTTGAGKVALLVLPTGKFAMQGIWANSANSGKGGCVFTQATTPTQLLGNPGFESGKLGPWQATPGVLKKKASGFPAHAGSWLARLGGRAAPHTDTLAQMVTVAPPNGTYGAATFSFWLEIKTSDPASKAHDTLTVQELTTGGTVLRTLATFSNLNAVGHYVRHSFTLSPSSYHGQPGQEITLKFIGTDTLSGHTTSFFIDNTALNAS